MSIDESNRKLVKEIVGKHSNLNSNELRFFGRNRDLVCRIVEILIERVIRHEINEEDVKKTVKVISILSPVMSLRAEEYSPERETVSQVVN